MKFKNEGKHFQSSLFVRVIEFFDSNFQKSISFHSLCKYLKYKDKKEKKQVYAVLNQLIREKKVVKLKKDKFLFIKKKNLVTGVLDFTKNGDAYLISEELDKDIYITRGNLDKAFDKDEVEILIIKDHTNKSKRVRGKVVRVLKRNKIRFIGELQLSDKHAFVVPLDVKINTDFYVPLSSIKQEKNEEIVEIKMLSWDSSEKNPIAEIVQVLGKKEDFQTNINKLYAQFDINKSFSKEVLQETEIIKDEISVSEIKKRLDLRNVITFTIDPDDAKDFDDAISLEQTQEGNYIVGVHIADVSYYVRPNSHIDKEAQKRSTSVYLVDKVVPMLPERLSNYICSLRPNEDKLSFSILFEFDNFFEIKKHSIKKSIINSNHRFTYNQALDIIEDKANHKLEKELKLIYKISKKIREKRKGDGFIDFDKKEVKFELNDKNEPIGIQLKSSNKATNLIEELMLLANKTIASEVKKSKDNLSFIYRIHPSPDSEKLKNLSTVSKNFGYNIDANSKLILQDINKLLNQVKGKEEENIIKTLVLRSMSKAVYSIVNENHFGLSFRNYTHFTSPIRRYADLEVHRKIYEFITSGDIKPDKNLEFICKRCTEMEIKAVDAERTSLKYMQSKFFETKLGRKFSGIVSGVSSRGIFVEILETLTEGFIKIEDLFFSKDVYLDDSKYCWVNKVTGDKLSMGDKLEVIVNSVEVDRGFVNFVPSVKRD